MSTLKTSNFQSLTAGTPPVFKDLNGTEIGQLCRAWVNFNGTTSSPSTIRGSFNVSSVTKNGTGDYTINFTTAMVNANYCSTTCSDSTNFSQTGSVSTRSKSTASIQIYTTVVVGVPGVSARTLYDLEEVNVAIFR